MKVLAIDWSFAKTGVAVLDLSTDKVDIIYSGLIETNPKDEPMERVRHSLHEVIKLYNKHAVELIIKESSVVGRQATAMPVIKSHGALEYYCYVNTIPLEEMHNQTIKAFARRCLIDDYGFTKEEVKKLNTKEIVAKFLELWYNRDMKEIYTPRGRLLDDIADAILIGIVYKNKHNIGE